MLGDVSIGRESSVWYNAVLRGDNAAITIEGMEVPPGSLVVGVPGRVVRGVDEKLSERAARNMFNRRNTIAEVIFHHLCDVDYWDVPSCVLFAPLLHGGSGSLPCHLAPLKYRRQLSVQD